MDLNINQQLMVPDNAEVTTLLREGELSYFGWLSSEKPYSVTTTLGH